MRKEIIYTCCLFLFLPVLFYSCGKSDETNSIFQKRGAGRTIIETGELAAVNSKAFVLPRYGRYWYEMRIIGILDHGEIVKPGDSIIQLDPTEINKFILERETNFETQLATLEKLLVDQANTIHELESTIKSEKAAFELKKIELESSRFESERTKRIKQLEFEQARINLEKAKQKLEQTHIINQNDLKIQQIRVQQIKNEIESAISILPDLTIRTPIGGVFQIAHNWRTNSLVKVGDNIYPGNNLGNVPDLEWMKVNTYINENDFLKIRVGQKVNVRLDAMPNIVFDGEIEYIGKLCHLKDWNSRQKVFDVEVKILKSDHRLKPGMTVSCEFLDCND